MPFVLVPALEKGNVALVAGTCANTLGTWVTSSVWLENNNNVDC